MRAIVSGAQQTMGRLFKGTGGRSTLSSLQSDVLFLLCMKLRNRRLADGMRARRRKLRLGLCGVRVVIDRLQSIGMGSAGSDFDSERWEYFVRSERGAGRMGISAFLRRTSPSLIFVS